MVPDSESNNLCSACWPPRVKTKNSGSRLYTSLEERSINRLTKPSVRMVLGMAWCLGSSDSIECLC